LDERCQWTRIPTQLVKADLDFPGRYLGVFLLSDEIELGGADVGVAGEFPHLVHRGPVADGVVDRRLA
jgi:hypothetical protein